MNRLKPYSTYSQIQRILVYPRWTRTWTQSYIELIPSEKIFTLYMFSILTGHNTNVGSQKSPLPSSSRLRLPSESYEFKTSGTSSYHEFSSPEVQFSYRFVSLTYTYCMQSEGATLVLISRKIAVLEAYTCPELRVHSMASGKSWILVTEEMRGHTIH